MTEANRIRFLQSVLEYQRSTHHPVAFHNGQPVVVIEAAGDTLRVRPSTYDPDADPLPYIVGWWCPRVELTMDRELHSPIVAPFEQAVTTP